MSLGSKLPGSLLVVKFGETIDISKRLSQHQTHFSGLPGSDIKVRTLLLADCSELKSAEGLVRDYFSGHPRAIPLVGGRQTLVDGIIGMLQTTRRFFCCRRMRLQLPARITRSFQEQFGKDSNVLHALASSRQQEIEGRDREIARMDETLSALGEVITEIRTNRGA
ncbi:hypothetical protein HDU87_008677 [Geranomyces variabilis]|uniref:Uncharacterized protein n=1 Tax=Geranomyces variabilis TaxID=109894 RepID=A0AAD5TCH0_9FUNG|nr:hypothetical protein HDU87_008677 [Geranomyces variabilis]